MPKEVEIWNTIALSSELDVHANLSRMNAVMVHFTCLDPFQLICISCSIISRKFPTAVVGYSDEVTSFSMRFFMHMVGTLRDRQVDKSCSCSCYGYRWGVDCPREGWCEQARSLLHGGIDHEAEEEHEDGGVAPDNSTRSYQWLKWVAGAGMSRMGATGRLKARLDVHLGYVTIGCYRSYESPFGCSS